MLIYNIDNQTSTYNIFNSYSTWRLWEDKTIATTSGHGIYGAVDYSGNTIEVYGTVSAPGGDGIHIEGASNTVRIDGMGDVSGSTGVRILGNAGTLINYGSIVGSPTDYAVYLRGTNDSAFTNANYVEGDCRIEASRVSATFDITSNIKGRIFANSDHNLMSGSVEIENKGLIDGSATNSSIFATGGSVKCTNEGFLIGGVQLQGKYCTFINYGKTDSVLLGSGNDTFENRGNGKVNGTVVGGDGNDTYRLDSRDVRIIEGAGQGVDTIQSSVTFSLEDTFFADQEFEHLGLVDAADINGTGNNLNNQITGNRGANKLNGQGGNDDLDGFTGSDTLFGGTGNDTLNGGSDRDFLTGGDGLDQFVFNMTLSVENMDYITDFTPRDDSILLDDTFFKMLGSADSPTPVNYQFFTTGVAAKDWNDYLIYNPQTGFLYYDYNGSFSGGMSVVANLGTNRPVTYQDFFVF